MIDTNSLDDIVKQLTESLPEGLQNLEKECKKNFRSIIQSTFGKFDLVTREEFDIQTKVLARTRMKLEALRAQVINLEKGVGHSSKTK